jgi:hypothetical protein
VTIRWSGRKLLASRSETESITIWLKWPGESDGRKLCLAEAETPVTEIDVDKSAF